MVVPQRAPHAGTTFVRRAAARFLRSLRTWCRRRSPLTMVLAAIAGLGIGWYGLDALGDDSPALDGDRFANIDAWVDEQLRDARIPGASLAIVENDTIAHIATFGNDGNGNEVTADTPFWIGSNTKSITALATMQLVEAGLIDLDAPVQDYLPEFRVADSEASARITIRHLLNQTSGLSRTDSVRAIAAGRNQTIEEVIADMVTLELNRPVGESFEYANYNSVVLGAVIEEVADQRWQDYVEEHIFTPLGMSRTYTSKEAAEANGLTATHRSWFGFPVEFDGEHLEGFASTGYVYATANDMARYLTMYTQGGELEGQRVLSEAGIAEMLTGATNERVFHLQSQTFAAQYGAGWFIGPFADATDARWHQGSLPHFTTWMVLLPDTDQAVIVMLNQGNQFDIGSANSTWSRIPEGIVNLVRGTEPPTGPSTSRFYVGFDTLVVLAVVAQAWDLARVLVRPHLMPKPLAARLAPLTWELLVAPLLLVVYPIVAGGLGWGPAFQFLPDLSLSVLVIAGLAVLTGMVRVAHLWSARDRHIGEIDLRRSANTPGPAIDTHAAGKRHPTLTR